MKIIISGATGFVGSNIVQKLLLNNIDFKTINLRNLNWKSEIDVQATVIIHLAGLAHDLKTTKFPERYFNINTKLTQELFDIFLESDCRDFIFFSSVKAVSDKAETYLTEDAVPNPQTPYGISKHHAEEYLLSKTLPQGKRLFIIRPSMIHGPFNKGNLNLLFKFVSKGIPWPLGACQNERSFCGIDNVCFVILKILESEKILSGIYNLADDETISTNDLISLIGSITQKRILILSIPMTLIRFIVRFGDYLKLPLNSERFDKLTENFIVSNAKIKAALQIEKFPFSAHEGLIKTIKSLV